MSIALDQIVSREWPAGDPIKHLLPRSVTAGVFSSEPDIVCDQSCACVAMTSIFAPVDTLSGSDDDTLVLGQGKLKDLAAKAKPKSKPKVSPLKPKPKTSSTAKASPSVKAKVLPKLKQPKAKGKPKEEELEPVATEPAETPGEEVKAAGKKAAFKRPAAMKRPAAAVTPDGGEESAEGGWTKSILDFFLSVCMRCAGPPEGTGSMEALKVSSVYRYKETGKYGVKRNGKQAFQAS